MTHLWQSTVFVASFFLVVLAFFSLNFAVTLYMLFSLNFVVNYFVNASVQTPGSCIMGISTIN